MKNKIGVISDSFRKDLREGLRLAAQVGADGVQMYAVSGEMHPETLVGDKRRELKKFIADLGLEISAICGDLGGHGFQVREDNPGKIETSKRILELALEMGCNIVTTHIGVVPEDPKSELYEILYSACEELGEYAQKAGAYFALETGAETAAVLGSFLDALPHKGVAVNFDPANMVMVTGDDPVAGFLLLKDYIVHTHVKDGVRVRPVDPRLVYGSPGFDSMSHENIRQMVDEGHYFKEVPLGQGDVDFDAYFKAVVDSGYSGYLTVEREGGVNPFDDIRLAVEFIKGYRD